MKKLYPYFRWMSMYKTGLVQIKNTISLNSIWFLCQSYVMKHWYVIWSKLKDRKTATHSYKKTALYKKKCQVTDNKRSL